MSGPILPVKKDTFANGLDECDVHRGPMGGAFDFCGLIMRDKGPRTTPGRRQNRLGLTVDGVFEGALISPSLFIISHNAESISAPCSRFPSTNLSIFLSILARVASVVESSIQTEASWSMYRPLISLYLHLSVGMQLVLTMYLTYRDVNPLKESSKMSHFPSSLRMWFRARVFRAGMLYCSEGASDTESS